MSLRRIRVVFSWSFPLAHLLPGLPARCRQRCSGFVSNYCISTLRGIALAAAHIHPSWLIIAVEASETRDQSIHVIHVSVKGLIVKAPTIFRETSAFLKSNTQTWLCFFFFFFPPPRCNVAARKCRWGEEEAARGCPSCIRGNLVIDC